MMKRVLFRVMMAALVTVSAPALASGSGSGGGGGGFGSVGSPFGAGVSQEELLQQRGRVQVKRRIACKTCEYKDGVTRDNAGEVAQAVRGGKFELADKDRVAVLAYLRQRYGV
jgi:hypothetical protein